MVLTWIHLSKSHLSRVVRKELDPPFEIAIIFMDFDIDELIGQGAPKELPKSIVEPYEYLVLIPLNNKNVRLTFLHGFNQAFYRIPNSDLLNDIDEVISIFHNSSLLIDDIEDSSDFRRGMPTSHTKFGIPLTINSGNLMYFVSLRRANGLSKYSNAGEVEENQLYKKISQILVNEMLNLHCGQGLDIYWRDRKDLDHLPSIEEYLLMIMNKTGGLFRLSVQLLECFADKMTSKTHLANLLGIIYQIRDDYLNLVDEKYSHLKGFAGEDLIEGKLSLPILHCLHHAPHDNIVRLMLLTKDKEGLKDNEGLIRECIDYIASTGSLDYTLHLLRDFHRRAREQILALAFDDSTILVQLVDKLCDL